MSLLRRVIGAVLRRVRLRQRRTLREVAQEAGVSLAYLSEIERGRKEVSSEVLAAICAALGLRLMDLLDEAREELSRLERGPATVPSWRRGGRPLSPTRPAGPAGPPADPTNRYRPMAVFRHRPTALFRHRSTAVLRVARCHFASSGSALGRIGFALPGPAAGWVRRSPGEQLAPRHTGGGRDGRIGQRSEPERPDGIRPVGGVPAGWCAVDGRRGGVVR